MLNRARHKPMYKQIDKFQWATAIALVLHLVGFIGILSAYRNWFVSCTSVNLLLMFVLLVWTHPDKNRNFFNFVFVGVGVGITAEMIGVNSGLLFGNYQYGKTWGLQINHVPWAIGLNWFIVMYCCGVCMSTMQAWFQQRLAAMGGGEMSSRIRWVSFILDGALLATIFDYFLEPAAKKLHYWSWAGGTPGLYNYVSWFIISAILLAVFKLLSFRAHNQFAVHLLIIQILFFAALRTFL